MKIFPCSVIKQLDTYTVQHEPITSIDLMERSAKAITDTLVKEWGKETPVVLFAGPGNNGGDALAVARMLLDKEYKVEVFLFNPQNELSPDCEANKELLLDKTGGRGVTEVSTHFVPPQLTAKHLVVDGLFGSGLNKPLAGGFAAVVKYINASPGTVVSIDVPSGLMGEDNTFNTRATIVHADYTFSLQLPKLAFFFAENTDFVGKWRLLDIGLNPQAIKETETNYFLLEDGDIRPFIKPRDKFAHKGHFGRALLIAGSYGMAGASILAARACLRSGIGLLTVRVPMCNNVAVQTTVPEAMTYVDEHEFCFTTPIETDDFQAVAIGPGLGKSAETEYALLEQINICQAPVVLDADALNILANHRQALTSLPKNSILTPHPKEMERLIGKCQNSYQRLMKACELAQNCKLYIVLKGAYTAVITPDGTVSLNPTGNPGMATAGSGDVLTGVILALLAQGYTSEEACKIGVYVHGLAGDLAAEKYGVIALKAGDIIEFLSEAWSRYQ